MTANSASIALWHARLGHISRDRIKRLWKKGMATGMKVTGRKNFECESCIHGKGTRSPFRTHSHFPKATEILGRVSTDLCGPMSNSPALDGELYAMIVLDQFSHYAEVFCLKEKSEALLHYQTYHNRVTNQHKKGIVILRVDGGGEFNSTAFLEFLNKTGTKLERTMPHSSQENPSSERINRTIMDIARCLLHYAGAPKTFWREAVKMAVYVHNRTPTKALHTQTPYEIWFGRKPDLSNLRVFGCTAYAILPETQRHK